MKKALLLGVLAFFAINIISVQNVAAQKKIVKKTATQSQPMQLGTANNQNNQNIQFQTYEQLSDGMKSILKGKGITPEKWDKMNPQDRKAFMDGIVNGTPNPGAQRNPVAPQRPGANAKKMPQTPQNAKLIKSPSGAANTAKDLE